MNSKLLKSRSNAESQFKYTYGVSFLCAVVSFLLQELNGICNIYWFFGHHRKHSMQTDESNNNQSSSPIKTFKSNMNKLSNHWDANYRTENQDDSPCLRKNGLYISKLLSHTAPSLSDKSGETPDKIKKPIRKVQFSSNLVINRPPSAQNLSYDAVNSEKQLNRFSYTDDNRDEYEMTFVGDREFKCWKYHDRLSSSRSLIKQVTSV
jgi:hypothetical protein